MDSILDQTPKKIVTFCVLAVLAAAAAFGLFNLTCGAGYRAVAEAENVAQEEFGARGLLEKYRFYKRQAAALHAKAADIDLMEKKNADTIAAYGKDTSKWPRDVRETMSQDRDALYALKASFNTLAAEYNAAMADSTKSFMNRGNWPRGWPADEKEPLRREFAEYLTH